jgi:hypothetical protein
LSRRAPVLRAWANASSAAAASASAARSPAGVALSIAPATSRRALIRMAIATIGLAFSSGSESIPAYSRPLVSAPFVPRLAARFAVWNS